MTITAQDDYGQTSEGSTSALSGNVLANDSSSQGAMAVVAINGSASAVGAEVAGRYGSFRINADGSYTYRLVDGPGSNGLAAAETGYDDITYAVRNAGGEDGLATLRIEVAGINDAPVAQPLVVTAFPLSREARGDLVTAPDIDGDAVTVLSINGVAPSGLVHGHSGILTVAPDGRFIYVPATPDSPGHLREGQTGEEVFTFTVSDGQGGTDSDTLTINVRGFDAPPVYIRSSASLVATVAQVREMSTASIGGGSAMAFLTVYNAASDSFDLRAYVSDSAGQAVGEPLILQANHVVRLGAPSAAGLAGGGAVVVWPVEGGLLFQLFDAAGNPNGGPHSVAGLHASAVQAMPGGGFVIAWSDDVPGMPMWNPTFQVFDATGTALTAPVVVASARSGGAQPQVVVGAGGEITMVWTDIPTSYDLKIRTYSSSGVALTDELTVGSLGTTPDTNPAGVALDDGRLLLYWSHQLADVRGFVVDPRSGALGPAFDIVGDSLVADRSFVMRAAPGGGFVALWTQSAFNGGLEPDPDFPAGVALSTVRAQLFDGDGNRVGGSFEIDPPLVEGFRLSDPPGRYDLSLEPRTDGSMSLFWFEAAAGTSGAHLLTSQLAFVDGGYAPLVAFAQSFGASAPAGGWADYNKHPRMAGDIDGDGRADLVGFGSGGTYAALTDSGGEAGATYLAINGFGADLAAGGWVNDRMYPRTLGDINGDGRADLVGFGSAGVYAALATGGGHFGPVFLAFQGFGANAAAGGWVDQRAYPRMAADINGDGLDDLVGFGAAGVYAALATGGGHFGPLALVSAAFGRDPAAGGWSNDTLYPRTLADIDGDGDDDLIGFGLDGTFAALANGDGTFGAAYLAYGGFGAVTDTGSWTNNDRLFRTVGDSDGDGVEDLIAFADTGVFVARGDGGGHFAAAWQVVDAFGVTDAPGGWTGQNASPRTVADINGDGAVDIVGFGDAGVFVAPSAGDWILG